MKTVDTTHLNRILAASLLVVNATGLIVYPLWPGRIGLLALILAALTTNTFWSLLHEGIHGRLLPNRRANRFVSRLLSIFLGTPFVVVQTSHLSHHAMNRTPIERPDVIKGSAVVAIPLYYCILLGGLYIGGLPMALTFLTPPFAARKIAERSKGVAKLVLTKLLDKKAFAELRIDGFLVTCLYGFALWRAPAAMVTFIVARAFLFSFFDYVYHYRTRLDDVSFAKNLDAGPWRHLLLGFNLHGVHHVRPDLPWTALYPHFMQSGGRYDGSMTRAALGQLRGPFRLDDSEQVPA